MQKALELDSPHEHMFTFQFYIASVGGRSNAECILILSSGERIESQRRSDARCVCLFVWIGTRRRLIIPIIRTN